MTETVSHQPDGGNVVTLSRADYDALIERLEDLEDQVDAQRIKADIDAGREEVLPFEMVERLIGGESPVRVWREHRQMTGTALAAAAGISASYLSEIEAGKKPGSFDAMVKLARALRVDLEDLVPWDARAESDAA